MSNSTSPDSSKETQNSVVVIDLISRLNNEKRAAHIYQKRKHPEWNENYELYRNRVRTNRLTQRQYAGVPLMKETIKTALSIIDDFPNTEWAENSGDEVKSLYIQGHWDNMSKKEKLELIDILDKKNVLIYGFSTKMLNLADDYVKISVLDPYDVLYDPLMNPLNIESARYIIHQNIFKSVREILASERYTDEGKALLQAWALSEKGLVQSNTNRQALREKEDRLKAVGVVTADIFGTFAAGDVIVNLSVHYTDVWNKEKKKFERHAITQAQDSMILQDKLLIDLIGISEYPFEYWCEDIETVDIYPDSIADLVRNPNKIINAWFSQLVENRTLRNFNMHWYDASVQGYIPQTYEPGQGRMLPAPGDPTKTIMPVNVDGLDGTMEAIQFITAIVERGSGVTGIDKGTPESGTQTLGEVQILVGKSQERANSIKPFYRSSWYSTAVKWGKIMQANSWGPVKLFKSGASGKTYKKTVTDKDWKSEAGFEPKVSSSSELEESNVKNLQKFNFVRSLSPNNQALKRIALDRSLMLIDVTPAEMREIKDEEEKLQKLSLVPGAGMPGAPGGAAPGSPATPPANPMMDALDQNVANLSQLTGAPTK
jgi:hypothetical protein